MTEESVPVVGFRNRIPRPVGHLGVDKYDAGTAITSVGFAPDIPVTPGIVLGTPRFLKPGVLIRGVVQHHFDDHPDATFMGTLEELLEIFQCSVGGMNR